MENLQLTMQPRLGACKNCLSLKHQLPVMFTHACVMGKDKNMTGKNGIQSF